MAIRKNVCIQYPTGGVVKRQGKDYPETKLLTVGSAFLDEASGRINGQFRAVPPSGWDGKFVILDPPARNADEG